MMLRRDRTSAALKEAVAAPMPYSMAMFARAEPLLFRDWEAWLAAWALAVLAAERAFR